MQCTFTFKDQVFHQFSILHVFSVRSLGCTVVYPNSIEISAGRPFVSAHIAVATHSHLGEQLGILPRTAVLLYDNLKFLLNKCFCCSAV